MNSIFYKTIKISIWSLLNKDDALTKGVLS
jgi:hypothetical protein